jgi:hypothetical protein
MFGITSFCETPFTVGSVKNMVVWVQLTLDQNQNWVVVSTS